LNIFRGLSSQGLPVIINGGDTFVERALAAGELDTCVKGINQECVFTSIESYNGDGVFGTQQADAIEYYKAYLAKCKQSGKLQVYLTEYMKEKAGTLADKIADYCRKNNFLYYIAPSIKLDRDF
jgi:endo-alpha-1,4-polygalactosaminidase (GH114 family)